MKKLLMMLVLVFAVSCSDNPTEPEPENYFTKPSIFFPLGLNNSYEYIGNPNIMDKPFIFPVQTINLEIRKVSGKKIYLQKYLAADGLEYFVEITSYEFTNKTHSYKLKFYKSDLTELQSINYAMTDDYRNKQYDLLTKGTISHPLTSEQIECLWTVSGAIYIMQDDWASFKLYKFENGLLADSLIRK